MHMINRIVAGEFRCRGPTLCQSCAMPIVRCANRTLCQSYVVPIADHDNPLVREHWQC